MGEQVKVTSLDALETFRARLIVFITKAKRSVDQATDEVRRSRQWLDVQQRLHWENELRKRMRHLDQARQELLSAKNSQFNESATVQKMNEKKALRLVEEAEAKLRSIKAWVTRFDPTFDPMVKKMDALGHFLAADLPKALVYLAQAQRALDDYLHVAQPDATAAPGVGAPSEGSP